MKFSNRKIIVFVFVFCIPLWSFNFPENILLNKVWTFEKGERNISFHRAKRKFDKSKFSFQLLEGGKLKIQQSGWCGTPPIEYEVVEGTWEKISDSVYILRMNFGVVK